MELYKIKRFFNLSSLHLQVKHEITCSALRRRFSLFNHLLRERRSCHREVRRRPFSWSLIKNCFHILRNKSNKIYTYILTSDSTICTIRDVQCIHFFFTRVLAFTINNIKKGTTTMFD